MYCRKNDSIFHCSLLSMCGVVYLILLFITIIESGENEKWKKKDIRDYTDADLERLYDQWEDNDDDVLPEDELPEWKRPEPQIDLSQLDPNNPEAMLQAAKKGRTLMLFASVSGDVSEKETEQISSLWQSSLFNANYELQRYVVSDNRVVFTLKDGSKAWEVKEYLIQQERCLLVTLEGNDYIGKGHSDWEDTKKENQRKEETKIKTEKKIEGNKKKVEL